VNKDDELFEVKDPEGRTIRLATSTWNDHIIIRHPEMKRHYEKVQKTITDPNVITETEDPKKDYSLCYSNNELTLSNLYVNVMVGFDDIEGHVRTSYLSPRLPKGKTIWIRKKY
jgi:hypothetical protein